MTPLALFRDEAPEPTTTSTALVVYDPNDHAPAADGMPVPTTLFIDVDLRAEAKMMRLRDIAYEESSNVRGGEFIAKAWTRPEHGTPELAELWAELSDLLESIPRVGLIEALSVCYETDGPDPAMPYLLAGHRRMATIVFLCGPDVLVPVTVKSLTMAERKLANVGENMARRNITPWRVAERFYELNSAHKNRLSIAAIAQGSGVSSKHVDNLVRAKRKVEPTIWLAWTHGDPSLSTDFIFALSPLDHEEQLKKWEAKKASALPPGRRRRRPPAPRAAPVDTESESESDERPMLTREQVGELRELVGTHMPSKLWREGNAWLEGATAVLDAVLLRGRFSIPDTDPIPDFETGKPKTKTKKKGA